MRDDEELIVLRSICVDDRQLTAASWQARLVKLADVYDNYCDRPPTTSRGNLVEKVRRAIACAGDDARLQGAVTAVNELLRE